MTKKNCGDLEQAQSRYERGVLLFALAYLLIVLISGLLAWLVMERSHEKGLPLSQFGLAHWRSR
jgi:hypothetical protein